MWPIPHCDSSLQGATARLPCPGSTCWVHESLVEWTIMQEVKQADYYAADTQVRCTTLE